MKISEQFQIPKITRRLILSFLGLSLFPLVLITVLNYYYAEANIEQIVTQKLTVLAETRVKEIESYAAEKILDAKTLASLPMIASALEKFQGEFKKGGIKSTGYLQTEKEFIPYLTKFKKTGFFYDIFLISHNGDIVFTVAKEKDLGTNLKNGPYKNTELAIIFKKSSNSLKTVLSRFNHYAPSGEPAAFIVLPVNRENEIVGFIGVQIDTQELYLLAQDYTGLGQTGEIVLASKKNNIIEIVDPLRHDSQAAFQRTVELGGPNAMPIQQAALGKKGHGLSIDYRGKRILSVWRYAPSFDWGVVTKIDAAEAFASVSDLRNWSVMILLVTMSFIIILVIWISKSIANPIILLTSKTKQLTEGDLNVDISVTSKDETSLLADAFREMISTLKNTVRQADRISLGDYTVEISPRSDKDELSFALQKMAKTLEDAARAAEKVAGGNLDIEVIPKSEADLLSISIDKMIKTLKKTSEENELNTWYKNGQTELSEQLRGDKDIHTLSTDIITFLAKYLETQVATFYVADEKGILILTGTYAFTNRKAIITEIKPGQGLVGQTAREKKHILLSEVPDDYLRVDSSLGHATPKNILAVPVVMQDQVKGVIELASFKPFDPIHIDFVNLVSETIAIAINSASERQKTIDLLEQTQMQAEELQSQQEELKASNEELEEQTTILQKNEAELKTQQEELQAANEELEEKSEHLERQTSQTNEKNRALEYAQDNIKKKVKELEISTRYKSEFLANMSHELRTPLNSLLILSHYLSENKDKNLNEEQIESAKIVHNCGTQLLELINEILDLSKIEAGKMSVHISSISFIDIKESIKQQFKHLLTDKGLDLLINFENDLPQQIQTDRQRLEQIIKNLMSNALKFTDTGSITIDFKKAEANVDLSRSGLTSKETVAIAVSDTGIGIPEDKQLEVFEAFQQADGSSKRKYGGTGLGLSISRQLATLLGGEINLESQVGMGSIFTVYLPYIWKEKPESSDKEIQVTKEIQKEVRTVRRLKEDLNIVGPNDDREKLTAEDKVILIIEDDLNFAEILQNQAHKQGFKVIISSTGEQGLDLVKKHLPVAVILDIRLPGMDGWGVLDILKHDPNLRHIPVHLMSVDEKNLDAFKKGAMKYLEKPVSKEDLVATFDEITSFSKRITKRILIIEDEENMRESIKKVIEDNDLEISEASDGETAFKALSSIEFDCIVLDLSLPDMSGAELLGRLKNEKQLVIPPVIIYTGKELTEKEAEELEQYADSIIVKGVKSEERLLDETSLFLHRVIKSMPENRQKIIAGLYNKEDIFKGRKILLVDDDMRNLFAISKVLKKKEINVLKAENGKKALEVLAEEKNIELVLMDLMMPVMDGYEAIKQIRLQPGLTKLPIIALTAKAMVGDREKSIEAGANDYISKPVDMERLLSLMRIWLYKDYL